MAQKRLDNYLRAHRKHSGLTQQELAFLLGCEDGGLVSRYERRRRLPPLETALACEAIFGVPVGELFAGVRERIDCKIKRRRTELNTKLQTTTASGSEARMIAHKLRWLDNPESISVAKQSPVRIA